MHYLLPGRFPDDRVLIAGSSWDNAKIVLREIVGHYRDNEALHFFFPELKPLTREEQGNTEQFTLPCRHRRVREPSIDTSGPDRIVTGRHYELIRAVDLVVEQNVPPAAQPEQMQQVVEYFRKLPFLLDTTVERSRITVDGTCWHDADLYSVIRKDPAFAHFKKHIIGIREDEQGRPIPIWNRIGREVLERVKASAGAYWWAANFKNDPIPMGAYGFRKEWFRYYTETPAEVIEKHNLDVAVTVDLAISDRQSADRSTIVTTGLSPHQDLYVLSAIGGRWTPYELYDHLVAVNAQYRPRYIGIESVAWQKAMIYIARHESFVRGITMPIRLLAPDASKERRAWPLMVHAEARGIWVRPEHSELVDECLRFPIGLHDDYLDALAYRGQDLLAPSVEAILRREFLTSAPPTLPLTGDKLLEMCLAQEAAEGELPWEETLDG